MKNILLLLLLAGSLAAAARPRELPDKQQVLQVMTRVNAYFMQKYADYTLPSNVGRVRPSNIWTRGVYYEGLMALHRVHPRPEYHQYALQWAEFHQWGLRDGNATRNADNQCCGQTYIDLYRISPSPEKIHNIKECMDMLLRSPREDDWSWIDAIQMAMPVMAKLGVLLDDPRYHEKMFRLYSFTRDRHGPNGLFNPADGLWWRDKDFAPPYTEPSGKPCYWSRGNGWVYAALVRVLDEIPADEPRRALYASDFLAMSAALLSCQRPDGFWNVSLLDPSSFGGKETTGTSLFLYGLAWGINNGLLDRPTYLPALLNAWEGLVNEAVHPNGFLGWVQGTGKEPKDGQPLSRDRVPDFEDFAVGCFLLGATELYKLSPL
ncbi:MAG: glycoside hydrolase family 88 protein [Odoribacteraceae bacterium]|jgi:rhamnogalacturonyl hydrolase YesR|nr:glycoside hydrolase family 88 protein [Odoribacteraceae bacterium]